MVIVQRSQAHAGTVESAKVKDEVKKTMVYATVVTSRADRPPAVVRTPSLNVDSGQERKSKGTRD